MGLVLGREPPEAPRAVAKNSLGKLSREAAVSMQWPSTFERTGVGGGVGFLGFPSLKQGRWAVGLKVHPRQKGTWY